MDRLSNTELADYALAATFVGALLLSTALRYVVKSTTYAWWPIAVETR
jgi:hypothetical protein